YSFKSKTLFKIKDWGNRIAEVKDWADRVKQGLPLANVNFHSFIRSIIAHYNVVWIIISNRKFCNSYFSLSTLIRSHRPTSLRNPGIYTTGLRTRTSPIRY